MALYLAYFFTLRALFYLHVVNSRVATAVFHLLMQISLRLQDAAPELDVSSYGYRGQLRIVLSHRPLFFLAHAHTSSRKFNHSPSSDEMRAWEILK